MWTETFKDLAQSDHSFGSILLRDKLPLTAGGKRIASNLIERASGLLAARVPVGLAPDEKRRLVFLLPAPTQSLGRFVAMSLLFADLIHRKGYGVSPDERGQLIRGDLLLVTQQIRDCVSILRDVCVRSGTSQLAVSEFWPIQVVSQYSPPPDPRPRVFVANPGWSSAMAIGRGFGTVVIDASHPRTIGRLPDLLRQSSVAAATVQILLVPPLERERLQLLLKDETRPGCMAWAWDPAAVDAVEDNVTVGVRKVRPAPAARTLWISSDPPVNDALAELHAVLVGAMRTGGKHLPAPLLEAWAIYHRLRQLSVPLVKVEEERQKAYRTVTIAERIKSLGEQQPVAHGELGAYFDAQWPRLVRLFGELYRQLRDRKEPSKFYTLAAAIEEALRGNAADMAPLRVVAPSVHEAGILAVLLPQLVTAWPTALQAGRATVTTVREEPRLVAQGLCQETLLLGFRTSDVRYLDVYPALPRHVICYGYEAEVDEAIQRRIHGPIEDLQADGQRSALLHLLRLPVRRISTADSGGNDTPVGTTPRSQRAPELRRIESNHPSAALRDFSSDDAVEPIDTEQLAGFTWSDDLVLPEAGDIDSRVRGTGSVDLVEILDTEGERFRFPALRLIDVFYPATGLKERLPAGELSAGTFMVLLVDDPYDDLFQRMLEAISDQRDARASMALELWRHAKHAALARHAGVRRLLYDQLAASGLSVEYEAVTAWFASGEAETLAPLEEGDFRLLARASGMYTDDGLVSATFGCIGQERTLRRKCGKILTRLLASLSAGQNYEAALASAKALGTPVEQLASAVCIREVESVSRPPLAGARQPGRAAE